MHDIIRLLETLGADARYTSFDEQTAQLEAIDDAEVRQAIQTESITKLETLLGVRSNVVCAIFAPEEEPEQAPEEDPKEQPEDEPEKESAIKKHSAEKLSGAA